MKRLFLFCWLGGLLLAGCPGAQKTAGKKEAEQMTFAARASIKSEIDAIAQDDRVKAAFADILAQDEQNFRETIA